MNPVVLFSFSVLPGLLWVYFFYRQDRYDREPFAVILKTFFFGMMAVVPAALIELPFRGAFVEPASVLHRFLVSVLVVGLGEETVKLVAAYFGAFRSSHFNEVTDGMIYGATAGLGFASLENLFYTAAFGLPIAPLRAVVTSLAHATFSGLVGYYLGVTVLGRRGRGTVLYGLALVALLHGLYDFLILANLVHPLFAIAMIFVAYRFLRNKIAKSVDNSPFRP